MLENWLCYFITTVFVTTFYFLLLFGFSFLLVFI
jgi:hypothetical protein